MAAHRLAALLVSETEVGKFVRKAWDRHGKGPVFTATISTGTSTGASGFTRGLDWASPPSTRPDRADGDRDGEAGLRGAEDRGLAGFEKHRVAAPEGNAPVAGIRPKPVALGEHDSHGVDCIEALLAGDPQEADL
jgi:hypothetical protein